MYNLVNCLIFILAVKGAEDSKTDEEVLNSVLNYTSGTTPNELWEPPLFYYFSNSNPNTAMTEKQVSELKKQNNRKKRLGVITHGFNTNNVERHQDIQTLKFTLLKNQSFDFVVIVSWIPSSRRDYYMAKSCLRLEAKEIKNVVKGLEFKLTNIELFGHSLGAHLMGTVARDLENKTTKERVFRVVGLDPAGIYLRKYYNSSPSDEISKDVAQEVVIINTNNYLGANDCSLGTTCYNVPEEELKRGAFYDDWFGLGRHSYVWKVAIKLLQKPNPWEFLKQKAARGSFGINDMTYFDTIKSFIAVKLKNLFGYNHTIDCPY